MRSEDEIRQQMSAAFEGDVTGRSKWPGMTYEQGVSAALGWVIEDDDTAPMEEEE